MNNRFDELTKSMAQSVTRRGALKQFGVGLAGMALACAALALVQCPVSAGDFPPVRVMPISGNAGVSVVFGPTADPAVLTATVTGVLQSSSLGTCVDNAQLKARFPATSDLPVEINGTATWTSIDGTNSLQLTVTGTATPDPANAGFYNSKYKIAFTGGTGAYASAKGLAEITEVVMFTSQATATATWNMKGFVLLPR